MATIEPRTPLDLLRLTAGYFSEKGLDSPRLDAEVLLAHVLSIERIGLYLQFDRPLHDEEISRYRELVRRRARGEPISYITGSREFWSLDFKVGPGVLIPRPDTELLVETALLEEGEGLEIAELGVGSGAVIVSILAERKSWRGAGVDLSSEALKATGENAEAAKVSDRLELFCGDLFTPLSGRVFDLLISNPPYIPTEEIETLAVEVKAHEPKLALDGGADGLSVIRRIAGDGASHLKPGGALLMEYGLGQEAAIFALLDATGEFSEIRILDDLTGRPRAVLARK